MGSNRAMRIVALLGLAILAVTCGPDPNAKLPFSVTSNGGTVQPGAGGSNTGGTTTVGTGGRTTAGSGGATVAGSGGRTVGSGGRGAGGVTGAGGTLGGSGGRTTGSGGRTTADAGVDARVNRDTLSGSGGSTIVGSGGSTAAGTGGRIGTGGSAGRDAGAGGAGSGGITGSGGATVPRDASGGGDVASWCVTAVVDNGYACGSATSCAECKDNNNNSREEGCKAGIDCLVKAGPSCNENCQMNCWNLGGDQYGIACVKALQTAACGASGC